MKNKQHSFPSFCIISPAVDGNENVIEKLLLFYEAYISKCCLHQFYDEYGNVYKRRYQAMVGFIKVPLFLKLLFSTLQKFDRLVLWEAVFILELHSAENQEAIPTIVYKYSLTI